jgi:hypothetical protein
MKKGFLAGYKRFSIRITPADLLSGDIDKREGKIELHGKRKDDLNGAVKRRLLSDINRHFWENPKDADDSRLVFEANETEKGTKYEEKKDGGAKLVLRISVGLAQYKPGNCGCC